MYTSDLFQSISTLNEDQEFQVLYVNDKPVAKYTDPMQAKTQLAHLQGKFPAKKIELKNEMREASDPSGMMHAARHYNKSFIITAELDEGGTKKYRIHAQSERVAREKFSQHYNMAKVLSVEEEGMLESQVNELSADLLKRAAQVAKNKRDKAMDPKIHDALGGGYMNPVAKHYNTMSDKFSQKSTSATVRDKIKDIGISNVAQRKIAQQGMAEDELDEVRRTNPLAQKLRDLERRQGALTKPVEQIFHVTAEHHGSNQDVPLYTKTYSVRANSEQEAIDTIRKIFGGRNHRIEQGVAEGRVATDAEHKKALDTLFARPDVVNMSRSLKKRDQDAEYDAKKKKEFKDRLTGVAETRIETIHGSAYTIDPNKYYVWAWDNAVVLYGEYTDENDAELNLSKIERRATKRLGPAVKGRFEVASGKMLLRQYGNEQGVAETKADPLGAWIAHKNGTEARKFKTREGAKKYVASHDGFTVSSSEAFHDTYRKKKVQEVKKFRTTYGWAGGSKEPRSAHAKQVAAKRKEYEKDLGKFEPTDNMVGTAKIVRDIAMSDASPEHKKAAIDALNKKGVAEDSLNEFDPGEHGIPPFTVYVGDTLIGKFTSYNEAQEEVEYQRGLDPRWTHDQWKIVNGIDETVWEYDVGEKSDDMRRQHKIQFIPRDNKDVAEGLPSGLSKSDYTPGATKKHVDTNCTTCHGRKSMYKLDGKLFADNKVGAERVKCPTCKGTGDKPGVAEAQNDYFKRRKDEEDRIAGTKAPAKRTPKQTDYEKKRKEQDKDIAEGGMPSSVIKSKQRYGDMSDKDFAELHQSKSDDDLVAMAWRHGYGKGSLHYVNKRKRGLARVEESRLYYNVIGTRDKDLKESFGMQQDQKGWFLEATAGRKRILEAHKAFGAPTIL